MIFDIYGTCVTRDAFTFENNPHSVNRYSSRSSLISAVQQPINIDVSNANTNSNFYNRMINEDLNKTFRRYARKPKAKYLIVDLIQERHPINFLKDIGFTTYSGEYASSGLPKGILYKNNEKVKLFRKYLKNIARLFENYEHVILHEVSLGEKYIKKTGKIANLPLKDVDKFFIEHGKIYHELFKQIIPNTTTIRNDGFLVDEKNKWGIGPSHFEDEYYIKFNEGLKYVIEHNSSYYYKK